jgi:hypothetical protein
MFQKKKKLRFHIPLLEKDSTLLFFHLEQTCRNGCTSTLGAITGSQPGTTCQLTTNYY